MKTFFDFPHFTLDLSQIWDHLPTQWEKLLGEADSKAKKRFESGTVGFFNWPNEIAAKEIEALETTANQFRQAHGAAIFIGIGGSFLGPAAVMQALRSPLEREGFPVHWLTNVDPHSIQEASHFIDKYPNCATVVISKSGGTVETLSSFFHFSERLNPKGIVVITDPEKGELRRLATANGWKSFPVPPALGGRFSVLSAVGLFPCAMSGISAKRLLEGAKLTRGTLLLQPTHENPAALFALLAWLWDTTQNTSQHYLMPYWAQLSLLSQWYVQLWAESLGKNKAGFTPIAALGTSDQHSVLQLMKEGPNNKIVGFMDVENFEAIAINKPAFQISSEYNYLFKHNFNLVTHAALQATQKSLSNSEVPTYLLTLKNVSEESIGAFFFFHETACAIAGELYGIDAFDQPGVEESKKLLKGLLA